MHTCLGPPEGTHTWMYSQFSCWWEQPVSGLALVLQNVLGGTSLPPQPCPLQAAGEDGCSGGRAWEQWLIDGHRGGPDWPEQDLDLEHAGVIGCNHRLVKFPAGVSERGVTREKACDFLPPSLKQAWRMRPCTVIHGDRKQITKTCLWVRKEGKHPGLWTPSSFVLEALE